MSTKRVKGGAIPYSQLFLECLLKSLNCINMIHHIDATQQQIQIDPLHLLTTGNLFIMKCIALSPEVINL
jgi:hypothetical protein